VIQTVCALRFFYTITLGQPSMIAYIPQPKRPSTLPTILSQAEVAALLQAPRRLKTRAILTTLYAAGLRVSELVGLRLGDLTFEPRLSIRVLGKGRRERVLPLWKETATALRAWLAVRGSFPALQVFLNAVGLPLTRSGFEYILEKHISRARQQCPSLREKRISPHVLRHSCAMLALQATGDVRKVALWLGHASVQTTEMYVRADPSAKLDALNTDAVPGLRKGRFVPPDTLIAAITPRGPTRRYAESRSIGSAISAEHSPTAPHKERPS